jgi:probable H4MPT-linked C1 transfer pathway protein
MKMVNVIGLDIGGANTKAAFLRVGKNVIQEVKVAIEYFPFWKRDRSELPVLLKRLRAEVAKQSTLDAVGVTMTAELSDAFQTKREGINYILDSVENAFQGMEIFVLNVHANLVSCEEARLKPLEVASANWAATGWMVSKMFSNCIVIDVGSTSTSIIPIIGGKIAAEGMNDLEKLINGELVYTGALRTNVAAIVNAVPVKGRMARVSSELFATSGDVHLILGNIEGRDFSTDTADGRGKSRAEALARLARIICADIEMLSEDEIVSIAEYVYRKQIKQIARGLEQVYRRIETRCGSDIPIIVTGIGRKFLASEAAKVVGFRNIIDLGELLGTDIALASPCVGVSFMTASKLLGRDVSWKQS